MEAISIYKESIKELNKMKKYLGANTVAIDLDKLDSETAGYIKDTLYNAATKRINDISAIINSSNNIGF